MATDINLTWDVSAMTNATDITSLELFQKSGDHTAELDMAVFRTGATSVTTPAKTIAAYTHSSVANGTYTYGIFSKNSGGYGPGDLIDTAIVVS